MKPCITIYLSGECSTFGPNRGSRWQDKAISELYKIAKYDDIKFCIINHGSFTIDDESITDRQIKAFLFNKIRQSDIVICNLENTERNPYVAQEIQYASSNHINIIGIKGNFACSWLTADCDAVFDTLEEAVTYIKEYYIKTELSMNVSIW